MPLPITITNVGRAEIISAEGLGTDPVLIAEIGLGTGQYVPATSQTALVSEFKRLDTFGGVVVSGDIITVAIRDESADVYSVSEFGLYTDSGTLFAVYSAVGAPFFNKVAQSILLLSVDVKLTTIDVASLTFGDVAFVNPPATETVMGVAELATSAEVQTGTDAERIVTPAGLSSRTATATRTGIVELATDAEGQTGTDTTRAVTPAVMRADSTTSNTGNRVVRRGSSGEIAVGTVTSSGSGSFVGDLVVNNLNVGRGSGNLTNNVAVGTNALGTTNTATAHVAVGINALASNTSGTLNTALGASALEANTTGSRNVSVGANSLVLSNGFENTAVGRNSGAALTAGDVNTFIGHNSGSSVTTGSNHTLIGGYTGNQGGLDIRTAAGYVVLSDGNGIIRIVFDQTGNCAYGSVSVAAIGSGYYTQKVNGLNGSGYRLYANEVEVGIFYADASACISGSVGNRPYEIWANGSRAVRVFPASQNVAIGSTSDTGEKLQVNGPFAFNSADNENPTISQFITTSGGTRLRRSSIAHVASQIFSGSSSFGSSGYQVLPSGFIIQWGVTGLIASDGRATVTLPIAFPTAMLSATSSPRNDGTSGSFGDITSSHVGVFTTTTFQISLDAFSGSTVYAVYWIAIGH